MGGDEWFQLAQLLVWGMSGNGPNHCRNWKASEEFKELLGNIPPAKVDIKTLHECEAALTSRYSTLFLVFVILSLCLFSLCFIVFLFFVFLPFCRFVILYFCHVVFLSLHHAERMSERSQVLKVMFFVKNLNWHPVSH